jgi:predicted transcriptional regulator
MKTYKYKVKPKQLNTLYRTLTPARIKMLISLKKNKPASIQQLSRLLRRDYAVVWRDVRALEKLKLVELKKAQKGRAIKPIRLVENLVVEIELD